MARHWAEFEQETGGEDVDYFKSIVQVQGGPALDMGCGSGRLLQPLLAAGLDVDGSDLSADMLAVCRARLDAAGLDTSLYNLGNHELDLPRRYQTIFACGVIGLGGIKRLTRQAFKRCYEHLHEGGIFAFDHEVPWNNTNHWEGSLPEERKTYPWEWPEPGEPQLMSDGDVMEETFRVVFQDPYTGISERQIRFRVLRGDQIIQEEVQTIRSEFYTRDELLLLLELAGFKEVDIQGDYRPEAATMDSLNLLFLAKK
jgi:SAM-dependent methyltransferase